jgi:MFS family permease
MSSRLRAAIVGLLCLAVMVAYFDRVNLSVALADKDFRSFFQLSDPDRGLLNSAFFWSYVVMQIPAGWIIDRYGVKSPYAIGFLVWSLVSAGTAWTASVRQLFSVRLLLGVGESAITPAGVVWIRHHYPEKRRGLVLGIFMSAAKFGPALGAPLSTWLLIAYGWRPMFVILGIGALVWLVPWMLLVPNDSPRIGPKKRAAESASEVPFLRLVMSPVILGTVIGTFCYMYFVYFCMTWLPAYFVEARGLSLASMGGYTALTFSGMAVVAIAGGWLADRMIERGGNPVRVRKGFIIAGFLLASTEVVGALSDSAPVAIFFAVFSLSALGLVTANYWALTQTLMPGAAVGRISGVQNCAANIPGVVGPILTGWLKQASGNFEAPMHAIWIFLLLGVASYVFLVREKYVPR